MPRKKSELDEAFALQTPEDNAAFYAEWSATYDTGFAVEMDYQLPRRVAEIFAELTDGQGPVLDVGAGTGLVAEALAGRFNASIDALDISAKMLEVAAGKSLYRKTILGDVTRDLDIPSRTYRGVISSGTFTHGHVGPDGLDELLRVAESGALFVIAVNAEHYVARGFEAKFAAMSTDTKDMEIRTVRNYGDRAEGEHRNDLGNVVVFWKR